MEKPVKITSISEWHRVLGLPKPLHPLISLVDNLQLNVSADLLGPAYVFDFFSLSYKYSESGRIGYGQGYYDFAEGGLVFVGPNQLLFRNATPAQERCAGYTLFFHPDFLRHYPLASAIKNYGFFSYALNEALHLSDREKQKVVTLLDSINDELHTAIDASSQDVLISYLEVLLSYSNRFYKRQFITRKVVNNDILAKIETLLDDYFNNNRSLSEGIPTVESLAAAVNLSPRYLSDMLRSLIGQNAQQLIHEKLIEKAKEQLSITTLSVSEIAYALGFEYPQSFSKLFKAKTQLSPVEFRERFN